jgi:hypothetical protein
MQCGICPTDAGGMTDGGMRGLLNFGVRRLEYKRLIISQNHLRKSVTSADKSYLL